MSIGRGFTVLQQKAARFDKSENARNFQSNLINIKDLGWPKEKFKTPDMVPSITIFYGVRRDTEF